MDLTRFPPSRDEALRRLDDFLPRAGRLYAATRNADFGPGRRDNTSNLSPYLRYRLVTEQEVVAAALDRHGSGAEKFIQEVCWRTYWKGWLEMRPEVWRRFEIDRDAARDALGGGLDLDVACAEAGRTGIEGFDDWARELVDTGYLHNHARMWFASIWIFTLRLPWVLGADFFLRHLIDADPASNTLSWRWVAGLQTRGKTYLATAANIARYTEGRYNPRGLAARAHALTEPPLSAARPLVPLPSKPSADPALLLVTAEDLNPESLMSAHADIRGVLCAPGTADWPRGAAARAFATSAAEDAAARALAHFGRAAQVVPSLDPAAVIEAAGSAGVAVVVTPFAPVGPVADALADLADSLARAGMTLIQTRRSWDERFWPYADRGFFKLREQIPNVLAGGEMRG